jgi:hypothetical protein
MSGLDQELYIAIVLSKFKAEVLIAQGSKSSPFRYVCQKVGLGFGNVRLCEETLLHLAFSITQSMSYL